MTEDRRRSDVEGVPDFWKTIEEADHRCLILDYDGTLAPFRENRMEAFPLEGVVDLLWKIRDAGRTHLAIMTGRPLSELFTLLGADLDIPVSGSQGSEFRFADGTTQTHLPSPTQEERLARGLEEARSVAPSDRVERKVASVAVHSRGMPESEAAAIHRTVCNLWSSDAEDYDLECRYFCGGVELRLKGIDKGTALTTLLNDRPDGTVCVYLGDDETDEDAFRALRGRGIAIKVGRTEEETYATGRLADPAAVREFLKRWVSVTTGT